MWSLNNLFRFIMLLAVLAAALFSTGSFALSCKNTSGGVRQDIVLDQEITVPTATLIPGTLLWRSQTFTSTFVCSDTDNHPSGEHAFLYWDPLGEMQKIHASLEVGVTYNNIDIKPVNGAKNDVGPGTVCRPGLNGQGCLSPAQSQTLTVTYSVYIKATGNPPPASGAITDPSSYALFQVDGEGGLNGNEGSNFRPYLTGLSNIRFIACHPKVSVIGNQGNTVDFGKVISGNAKPGSVAKRVPFTVQADLTGPGQDCRGQTLMASFSTSYPIHDNTTILPTTDSGFGIALSQGDTPASFIPLNESTLLGMAGGEVVENSYLASLVWLSTRPKTGRFDASVTVDVTFK